MLTRVLRTVRLDGVDGRSQLGVYMRRLREELTDHVGGDPTTTERLLIEEAVKKAAIVQAVGNYVLSQESLVNAEGELLPVVMQHERLVAGLAQLLGQLGLERKAEKGTSLQTYLAARAATPPRPAESHTQTSPPCERSERSERSPSSGTGVEPSAAPAASEVRDGGPDISGTVGNETAPAHTRRSDPT